MVEHFPKLEKYTNQQIQEAEWISIRITPPQIYNTDIIIKFWKTKGKGT